MILAFDTSGPHVAVALAPTASDKIEISVMEQARGQAEALVPRAQALLDAAGIGFSDLTGIGVGIGPGNFTGIRISVSAARGMALGLGIPAIGVSVFDTTRHLVPQATEIAVPAPREQAYLQTTLDAAPQMVSASDAGSAVFSNTFATTDHIRALIMVTRQRLDAGEHTPPKPLYVKPADAAPARDIPPTIIDA